MTFLLAAYVAIWLVLSLFIISINTRQNRLIEDLQSLWDMMQKD